jgi:hypothetical protein
MVAVQKIRSMRIAVPIGGILRSATDAIRWGTLHSIVQALNRWRADHRQSSGSGSGSGIDDNDIN